jgi:two-component system chemotaxis family response regulator WspR
MPEVIVTPTPTLAPDQRAVTQFKVRMLPDTDQDGALSIASACRSHIEQLGIDNPRSPNGVISMSIGLATIVPSRAGSAEALVAMADKALYQAKNDGRNRVVVAANQ